MKKFFAIIIAAALIIALFAVPAGAADNIIDADDAHIVDANIDDFLWTYYSGSGPASAAEGGVTDFRAWMDGFVAQGGLGVSSAALISSFDKIILRGWIGFDREIRMFGYQVNDDEPVFDPYNAVFAETTEDSVKEKGGEYARRYRVVIPLSSGDQSSMRVVAKLVDGTIVKLNGTKKGTNTDFLTNNTDVVPFKSISNVIDYDDSEDIVMNLDRIDWNFSPLVSEGVTTRAYADTFLDPDDVLDAVQYSGSFISYAGWVCFTQPVIGFGYMVGGDIVLKEGFLAYNEEDDPNTGAQGLRSTISSWGVDGSNAQRFYINVPISSYTGTNEVCAVAQLQDGTVVKLNSELHHERSTAFTIKGLEVPQGTAAPATEPATAKPTDEPAPTDAPAPTEAPKVTDAPAPTGGKTYTDKTSAPDEKDVKKNNTGLVIGIVCGAVILAAAVAGIIVASKKKKK